MALYAMTLGEPYDDSVEELDEPTVAAFNPNQERDDHGRWIGDRASRAIETHKPVTRLKRVRAEVNEARVAKMIAGSETDDNAPTDVTVRLDGQLHGVEVKTFIDNAHDKITMHPASLDRKVAWGRAHDAVLHTVVFDNRPGHAHELYYKRGVGSFRLGGLTKVANATDLKRLMRDSPRTLGGPGSGWFAANGHVPGAHAGTKASRDAILHINKAMAVDAVNPMWTRGYHTRKYKQGDAEAARIHYDVIKAHLEASGFTPASPEWKKYGNQVQAYTHPVHGNVSVERSTFAPIPSEQLRGVRAETKVTVKKT